MTGLMKGCCRGAEVTLAGRWRMETIVDCVPRGLDVLAYVRALYEAVCSPQVSENSHVQKMKKYLNYRCPAVPSLASAWRPAGW